MVMCGNVLGYIVGIVFCGLLNVIDSGDLFVCVVCIYEVVCIGIDLGQLFCSVVVEMLMCQVLQCFDRVDWQCVKGCMGVGCLVLQVVYGVVLLLQNEFIGLLICFVVKYILLDGYVVNLCQGVECIVFIVCFLMCGFVCFVLVLCVVGMLEVLVVLIFFDQVVFVVIVEVDDVCGFVLYCGSGYVFCCVVLVDEFDVVCVDCYRLVVCVILIQLDIVVWLCFFDYLFGCIVFIV